MNITVIINSLFIYFLLKTLNCEKNCMLYSNFISKMFTDPHMIDHYDLIVRVCYKFYHLNSGYMNQFYEHVTFNFNCFDFLTISFYLNLPKTAFEIVALVVFIDPHNKQLISMTLRFIK